jgi:hypothetical protein
MRCKESVKYVIIKALEDRGKPIFFYEMREVSGTFNLKKCPLDEGEMRAHFPRRSRSIRDEFETVVLP